MPKWLWAAAGVVGGGLVVVSVSMLRVIAWRIGESGAHWLINVGWRLAEGLGIPQRLARRRDDLVREIRDVSYSIVIIRMDALFGRSRGRWQHRRAELLFRRAVIAYCRATWDIAVLLAYCRWSRAKGYCERQRRREEVMALLPEKHQERPDAAEAIDRYFDDQGW